MKKKDPCPYKEQIIQEIATMVAGYKLGPVDSRRQEEIADDWFDYINEKLDKYCGE